MMKETKNRSAVKSLMRPYRGRILLLCLAMLLQSILQVAVALLTRYVIDAAVSQSEQLLFWGGLLIGDLVALVIIHCFIAWFTGSTTDKLTALMREKLLRAASYSSDLRLQNFHSGQLLSRGMDDVRGVCDGTVNVLPSLVGQVTRLVTAFAAVLLIAPGVAAVLLVAAVAVVLSVSIFRPLLRKHHRNVRQAEEKVMSTMQEDLQQLELIQSLDAQENTLRRFVSRLQNSLAAKGKRRMITVSISSVLQLGMQAGTGALLLWGAVQVSVGALTFGALTAMLQLLSLFRGPVLGLSGLWTRLAGVEVAAERLTDLLQIPPRKERATVDTVEAVVFEHVTFRYPGDEVPVLEDFSVTFPLQKWACLTGISGKGKTTAFKLILGLYTPQSGRVYLKTPKGEIPCGEDTRHLFAYVPQDYALFSGTIRENFSLVSYADEDSVFAALEIAQAQFVRGLSAGLETQVRENNTGLSKGQLQRLAIARAILMERPILLLDECTSALDGETEAALVKALHKTGKQAILVTHRPDALSQLDDVIPVAMDI